MTGTEIYKRTDVYESTARSIRLHAPEWKLLLAYDGQRSMAEVALSAEVSFAQALPLTQKFLDQGWIEEQPITLEQYLKRTGAPNVAAIGSVVPSAVILHEPQAEGASPLSTSSAPPPVPVAKSSRGAMRLGAVVDYITSLTGNVSLGQLLVYRVFLRVPASLRSAHALRLWMNARGAESLNSK